MSVPATRLFARAGAEAITFAEPYGQDVPAAFDRCERGDWLLCAIAELGLPSNRLVQLLSLAVDELVAQANDPVLEAAAALAKKAAKGRAEPDSCQTRADELEDDLPEDTGVPRSATIAVIELLKAVSGEATVYSALEIGEQFSLSAFYASSQPGNGEIAFDIQRRELGKLAERLKRELTLPELRAALKSQD